MKFELIGILRSIIAGKELYHKEIRFIIELTQNFAFTYLKYRYKNLHKVFLAEDSTLNELAIDAIAPLFERDESGIFVKIQTAFLHWQPPIESEEEAQFFLSRIVAKSVEKYVSELLRDSDPFFSKILDQVNYQIEKYNYKKKQLLGTVFILEDTDFQNIGSFVDTHFILNLPSDLFFDMKNMLPKVFEYLNTNSDKAAAIPLNAFVNKVKQIKAANFNFTDRVDIGGELKVESILELALKVSLKKLDESYFNKGKISQQEKCGIETALRNITIDMRDGGINPGLHKYFLEQFPEESFDSYKNNYQNIFEYLYKVLRNEIVKQIGGD
ncbi:MAG: hypothetical protein HXY50_04225 [Ignavibacteriaceae bacterium]|nr:hypothetical protein [Ignavibacteriaceae bacterium]